MRRRVLSCAAVLAAFLAPSAAASPILGLRGDPGRFRDLTGQVSASQQVFPSWGSTDNRLDRAFANYGSVPLVAIGVKTPTDDEVITPGAIARGRGDWYLKRVNRAAARFGARAYIRPLGEMNGHWNPYCAYNADGSLRNRAHSRRAFKNAFRRIYVILHGGSRAAMNAKLARYGMPGVSTDLPTNPQVRVVWNPQGFGSPNIRGNMPRKYWPGRRFVDVVGDDLYDMHGSVSWDAADALYRRHPGKPFSFPEWGLWGVDDPAFVRHMRKFVLTHPRTELLAFYNDDPGSIFDLGTKPASRRAYRRYIVPLAG